MRRAGLGRAGVTMVDVLIGFAILLVLTAAAMSYFISLTDASEVSTVQSACRTEAEQALTSMVQELRLGTRSQAASPPNVSIPASPGNNQLTFYVPSDVNGDGTILDGSGNLEWGTAAPVLLAFDAATGVLMRTQSGASHVLARDVTAAAFEDRAINAALNTDEVKITLTLQKRTARGKTITTSLSGIVKLRNN